jgi:hypothetical protein
MQANVDIGETSAIDVNRIEVELNYWHDKGARNCSF